MLGKILRDLFYRKKIHEDVIIVDSVFPPSQPLGFRVTEINGLLRINDRIQAYTMYPMKPQKEAWFKHGYGKTLERFSDDFNGYLKDFPYNKDRIHYLSPFCRYSAKLAYSYFLAETFTLLPFYERFNIPFVFILYPGGAFGLNNSSSDAMLRRIFASPCFRKVITTQRVTREYLFNHNLCELERIEHLYGGYVQFRESEIPPKQYRPNGKKTFDLCFVAAKYTPQGFDKGYDLFIDAARKLVPQYPDMIFHVIGGFDETDMDISSIRNNIKFYGYQKPEFLKTFYPKMDICVSPSRLSALYEGNFHGFPLGGDAMCFKTLLITTDELNNNQGFFSADEIVIAKPDILDIVSKIEYLYHHLDKMYSIGENGQRKIFASVFNPETRIQEVNKILMKCLD